MSRLRDLINPPARNMNEEEMYKLLNTFYDYLDSLIDISNISQLTNADFSTLSSQGVIPTTPADGDDFEFIQDWFIVGATQATYVITATTYPQDSEIKTNSEFFVDIDVSAYSGTGLYFYQRQLDTVRKYQNQFITFTIKVNNLESELVKTRLVIEYNYGPSFDLIESSALYLQPGDNELNVVLSTPSLRGKTVDASNYVEFRFEISNLYSGTADMELYQIKAEFGQISTPLTN